MNRILGILVVTLALLRRYLRWREECRRARIRRWRSGRPEVVLIRVDDPPSLDPIFVGRYGDTLAHLRRWSAWTPAA